MKNRASRPKSSANVRCLGQRLDPNCQGDRSSLEPARRILSTMPLLCSTIGSTCPGQPARQRKEKKRDK